MKSYVLETRDVPLCVESCGVAVLFNKGLKLKEA